LEIIVSLLFPHILEIINAFVLESPRLAMEAEKPRDGSIGFNLDETT
jgi:hypothetical protein